MTRWKTQGVLFLGHAGRRILQTCAFSGEPGQSVSDRQTLELRHLWQGARVPWPLLSLLGLVFLCVAVGILPADASSYAESLLIYPSAPSRAPEPGRTEKNVAVIALTSQGNGRTLATSPVPNHLRGGGVELENRLVSAATADLMGYKIWTNPDYTRLVFHFSRKIQWKETRESIAEGNARIKLTLTLTDVHLSARFRQQLSLKDGVCELPGKGGLVESARLKAPPNGPITVELLLLPISSLSLTRSETPHRLVIDVFGQVYQETLADPLDALMADLSARDKARNRPARVVLDPGHGGTDTGATGQTGTLEKDVTLAIALKTRDRLKGLKEFELLLTRETDTFVALDDRTRLANDQNADLFVSIHANANPNHDFRGIETYYLENATDEAAAKVAAAENAPLLDKGSLEFIVADLLVGGNVEYSKRLARSVHESVLSTLSPHYPPKTVKDLGVKTALFYVLFGAQMPSILLETAFISNTLEEKRLVDPAYQDRLADAIRDGLLRYVKEARALYPVLERSSTTGGTP